MSTSRLAKEISATKAFYEKHAREWAKNHSDPFHDEKEFRALQALLPKNASVVDIGCAAGVLVPLFLGIGNGLRYTGIDIARSFIKLAQSRYPKLTFIEGNIADSTTLPKKKFDAFLARAVIMHVPYTEWDAVFANIERLVKPGGYGYIVLPENRPPFSLESTDTRHFTLLTKDEQVAYIKLRNWKIIKKFAHTHGAHKASWCGYIVKLP
jgi:SAM-dependent methyltransferase